MTEKTIVFLPRAVGLPAPWRKLSADGYVIGRGELAPDETQILSGEWIVVAPAEDVAVRWLSLPEGNTAQKIAAARWQMSEQLGHDLTDDDVVLGHSSHDSTPVAAVRRSLLATWQNWIDTAGLHSAPVIPAQLCVPVEAETCYAVSSQSGDVLISTTGLSALVSADLVEELAAGQNLIWTTPDEALDRLALGALASPLNLLSSAVGKERKRVSWKQITALAVILCLTPAWVGLAQIAHDKWAQRSADKAVIAQAIAYMPELANQDDVLEQADSRLQTHPPLGSYTKTLAALVSVLAPKTVISLSEVSGANGELRGVLRLSNADDANRIRESLMQYGLNFTGCEPTNESGQSVCAFVIGASQ